MAIRAASPKLLNPLRHLGRALNSSSVADISPFTLSDKAAEEPPVLDLNDAKRLFSSVTTGKLAKSAANMHMVAVKPMVDLGMWMMNSKLMDAPVLREAMLATVKHTFYEQFCAGEDAGEVGRTMEELREAGLKGMMVYAVEDCNACDRNLHNFLATVELAQKLPPSTVSFVVVKLTAIVATELLKKVSDLLRWQQRDPSLQLPWKQETLPLFGESSPLYHTMAKPEALSQEEELALQEGHQRLLTICGRCQEAGVPVAVDAEYTSIQPAIDYLTYSSALCYRQGRPLVYGTVQAYLKDAQERLMLAADAAEEKGVSLGIKLVRGAYMSSESKLASALGYASPVHSTIDDTHTCYNECASWMLERIARGNGAVVLATHNVDSGKMVASKARDLGIAKGNQMLHFAQLYGMSDGLSFGLRNAGFEVSKYLPYGPVDKVIPYLLRRAEENRGLLQTSTLDRQLMTKELIRRFKDLLL